VTIEQAKQLVVWLTLAEAADHVRASKDTISAAVSRGDLPAYRIGKGREYRLRADEVDEWLSSRAYEPRSV
jgi:excisionase family DNA binding protein